MAISHGSHSRKSLWNSIPVMPHRCDPYGQKSEQSKTVIGTFSQLNWFPGCCTSSPGHPQEAGAAWQLSALDCKGGGGHGAPLGGKSVGESGWEGTRLHPPLTQHPRRVSPMLEVAARGQQGGWPLPGPLSAANAHHRIAAGKLGLEGKPWSTGLLTAVVVMVLPAIYLRGCMELAPSVQPLATTVTNNPTQSATSISKYSLCISFQLI